MADFLSPIINAWVSLLKANLPTEIDAIDSALEDVPNANYFKARLNNLSGLFPSIEIFTFGDSDIDADFTNDSVEFLWRIATLINIMGEDEEDLQSKLNKYTTAIMKASAKSDIGQDWTIDNTVDLASPTSIGFAEEEESITATGLILWAVRREEDFTS